MMENILNASGVRAVACGNLGRPFCDAVLESAVDYLVVELSSFQLESSALLRLDGAIIVNITPDHLDRHASFAEYLAAKLKIATLLNAGAPLVAHDSLEIYHLSSAHYFSGYNHCAFLKEWQPRGFHNRENGMAAATLAHCLGIGEQAIARGLLTFKALPHRCEIVCEHNGILFVNDSKGTTVEAVKKALSSFAQPTHLLLGGMAKGEDFGELSQSVFPQVKSYYVYGRDQQKILTDLQTHAAHSHDDLSCALRAAVARAQAGDAILLSPGCASYDQFVDYQHRGQVFKTLAQELTGEPCA